MTTGEVDIEVRVLGAIEVRSRPRAAEQITGLAGRLLACLAIDRGRTIDDDILVERLWPDGPPLHAIASVRNLVAKLRRCHGAGLIVRASGGYQLPTTGVVSDLSQFEALLVDARSMDDPCAAAAVVDEALAMVRGEPFHEVADDVWAMPGVASAKETVATAEELWAELALEGGRASERVARLRTAALALPHRELRWGQLVRALAAAGRRTEALRALDDARRALAEFGMMPGAELGALERQMLRADVDAVPPGHHRIPIRRDEMVGRGAELTELLRPTPIVWLEGESGSGKTRLLAEVADRATETIVYVSCDGGLGSGEGPLAALAGRLAELIHPDHEPLSSHLDPGDAVDPSRDVRVAPGFGRALATALSMASSERDLLVMIDDVQSLGDASAPMVRDVVMRTMERVRWIIASRPLVRTSSVVEMRGELERTGAVRAVRLGPLGLHDVHELVRSLCPDLSEEDGMARAADVHASTGGHALFAREVINHGTGGAGSSGGPPRLDAIVAGALQALAPPARSLVELLAVAGGPCPVRAIAAATGMNASDVLSRAEHLEHAGLLAPFDTSTLDLRHDLIRRAVDRQISPAAELAMRRRLACELGDDERWVVLVAHQLLGCGDLLDAGERDRCHRAVAAAIASLLRQLDYAGAETLASRYLDRAVAEPGSTAAATVATAAARLQAATALIANGDVGRGRSVLEPLIGDAEACGDLTLLADAVLARGPMATGGTAGHETLQLAERLVAELPDGESRRRVQLACWAAHQRLNVGDRLGARRLLDVAELAIDQRPDPVFRGLILAVRAQSDTFVSRTPDAARASLEALQQFARRSGDLSSAAAAGVLGLGQSFGAGTLDDVRATRDTIAAVATHLPRPDLRWWPLAVDAALELAAGRVDTAAAAIERAAQFGLEMRVDVSSSVAHLQQMLLMLLDGRFGAMASALRPLAAADMPSGAVATAYGLACVEAGDLDEAANVAERMAGDPGLLVDAGMRWGQVAMGASEVAFAARHVDLARILWPWLQPYSGCGLAVHGAGYFGSVDRCLALLAATLGDTERAAALVESARAEDAARGAWAWERRATADAARISMLSRGGRTASTDVIASWRHW